MTMGSNQNGLESLRRRAFDAPSMLLTSDLAHHPLGDAVARSPHPASGGGGEGWSILLVGQSERGKGVRPASIEGLGMHLVQALGSVWRRAVAWAHSLGRRFAQSDLQARTCKLGPHSSWG